MNNKSGSERLKAWVHWKLLEKDLDEDDKQFALDIQDLQKLCEEQKGEIAGRKKQYELVKEIQMSLEKELDTWKEVAAENERQRVRWMKQSERLESQLATQTERIRVLEEALKNRYHDGKCLNCGAEIFKCPSTCEWEQALNQESLGDGE